MSLLHLTDANFKKEVLESELPVLVDYWAQWCMPCKMIAPFVEELAKEYHAKIKIGKVNVDENPQSAGKYGVMSIPTLIIFKGGQPVKQMVGVQSKEVLINTLSAVI